MSTLSNTVQSLEDSAEDGGLRWEVLTEAEAKAESTHHLDGAPRKVGSVEDFVGQLPFQPPPAPGPAEEADMTAIEQSAESQTAADTEAEPKVWKATLTLTQATSEDGQGTVTASFSPLMRIPNQPPDAEDPTPGQQYIIDQPTERMVGEQEIQDANQIQRDGNEMLAISVKRQRKLKMKKHKYKKLMKRTRTLRRKLGRI